MAVTVTASTVSNEKDELIIFVNKFESQMRVEVINQHVLWLRALFDQFQLLDHRLAIKDSEYRMLKNKLPTKSQRLFEQLTGVDKRMQDLPNGIKVLQYTDLNALVQKVADDLQSELQSDDRMKLRRPQSMYQAPTGEGRIFQNRLSQQIQGAQNTLLGSTMRRHSLGTHEEADDDGLDEFLSNSVDVLIQEEKL